MFSKLLPKFIGEVLSGMIGTPFQNQMATTAVELAVSGTLVAFDKFVGYLDTKSQESAKRKNEKTQEAAAKRKNTKSTSHPSDTFSKLSVRPPATSSGGLYNSKRPGSSTRQDQM